MEGKVCINKLALYGYHGCLEEEAIAGARFLIDAELYVDFTNARKTDNLHDTVDYEKVIFTIKESFKQRAMLIEYAGELVIRDLKRVFPMITKVVLTIHKPSAPISAEFGSVSVTFSG